MSTKPRDFSLREALKEDTATLSAIHKECFPNYWNIDAFNDFFGIAGTFALLAETSVPAGMMVCRLLPDEAEIITIAVSPGWRRRGIARAMMDEAMARSRAQGALRMFLDVEENNREAIALYEGYGFTVINRRRQYYRQKDGSFTDALVMRCKLY